MAQDNEILRRVSEALDRVRDTRKQEKETLSKDRDTLLIEVSKELSTNISRVIKPILEDISKQARVNREDLIDAFGQIRLPSPEVNIPPIELPTINVPKPSITVNIPEVKLPVINVPKNDINFPSMMKMALSGIDFKNPLPVILMDNKGHPYIAQSMGGSSARQVSIQDITTNSNDSILDSQSQAMRVTLVSGAGDTTVNVAQWAGNPVDTNIGPSGGGTLRVTIATDSVSSTTTKEVPDATSTFAPTNADSTVYAANLVVKASSGVLYSVTGYNSSTASQFIQIHNTTTQPAEAAVPIVVFTVPGSSNFFYSPSEKFGKFFSTGITVTNSTTGPTKTVGGADCWFNVLFQ